MSDEERIAKLEEQVQKLESQTSFRLVLVALGALLALIVAIIGFII